MSSFERPFHSTVEAAGFALAPSLIGTVEARQRAVRMWASGTTIYEAPDGSWIMVLPAPLVIRADHAPGLALIDRSGALVGVGAEDVKSRPGTVVLPSGGSVHTLEMAALPGVDVSGWVDIGDIPVHRLTPLDEPPTPPTDVREPDAVPPLDIRRKAGIGTRSRRVARDLRGLANDGTDNRGRRRWFRGGAAASGMHTARGRGWVAKLAWRGPTAGFLGRRHSRYIRELTQQFNGRQWDDALRNAIALGGSAGKLRLRLPHRRLGRLTPTARRTVSSGSLPYGANVHQHLQTLYRSAASELERQGRVTEAAYILADLLETPADAVALLERHGELKLAAELAEGRSLQPDLIVRLWWKQGNRERAIDVARARGAFAGAVQRSSAAGDMDCARSLRVAWIEACRIAGDPVGVVTAAWPDDTLRATVIGDLRQGMGLGGLVAARLLAYLVTYVPDDAARKDVETMLNGRDDGNQRIRQEFLSTFADLRAGDPAYDRELASLALRAMFSDTTMRMEMDDKATRRVHNILKGRADPLLVADLPALPRVLTDAHRPLEVTAGGVHGQAPVFDMVPLSERSALVALGELGARLITIDGRVIAKWDIPTHQIVMSDHGGSALLVAHRDTVVEIHRLDMATRQVRRCASLATRHLASTFDGAVVIVADNRGISFIDTLGHNPRALWRALEPGQAVYDLARSATTLAAIVGVPTERGEIVQGWTWQLPGITLRARGQIDRERLLAAKIAGDGRVVSLYSTAQPDALTLGSQQGNGQIDLLTIPAEPSPRLLVDTGLTGVVRGGPSETSVELAINALSNVAARISFPHTEPESIRLRSHDGFAAVWDHHGRCVIAQPTTRTLLSTFRVVL